MCVQLCDNEDLWEQVVRRGGHDITPEIEMMASKFSWRRICTTLYQDKALHGNQTDMDMDGPEDKEQPCESP